MKLHILIISESKTFGDFLTELLTSERHTTSFFQDTKAALNQIRSKAPDLVIIEISSAKDHGLEFDQRLQSMEVTRHIPVIVISDFLDLEEEMLNVFDFIPKPVDFARLHKDIDHLSLSTTRGGQPFLVSPMSDQDYKLFHDFLLNSSGLHFDRNNRKNLERSLIKRMTALRLASYRDYYNYLIRFGENRRELQKLYQFLTVGETYFFRYHGHFDVVRNLLLSQLLTGKSNRIRYWSAGCSTGEEPYSLAMAIMDALPDWRQRNIKIIATDINNQSLNKARDGVYRSWAIRSMDKKRLERYFDRVGQSFIIKDEVKSMVEFSHLNLSVTDYQRECPELHNLDAIFCRNVMIYFTATTTRSIVEKFTKCLKLDGHLFLGHSETLANISTCFERQRQENSFFYRLKSHKASVAPPARLIALPTPPPPPLTAPVVTAPNVSTPSIEELYKRANELFDGEDYVAAEKLLDLLLQQDPTHVGALVAKGFILAYSGRSQEALELCNKLMSLNDLLPELYYLRGLLHDMTDQQNEAVSEYRKAILLDMNFVMPRHHLGRLYVRQGKKKEGERELRNSLKILSKEGQESLVPFSGGLSREVFMIQLQSALAKIS